MDPITNLKEQLELSRRIIRTEELSSANVVVFDEAEVVRLAELVLALDEWMRKGGFSPWSVK